MKRTLTLIACVAVCSAMIISCKNNKKTEPSPEEIQAQKVALADSVLAQIDVLYQEFNEAFQKGFFWWDVLLTEEEKMVKPDYLLDPSVASSLVTKSQKVNALAIYTVDLQIMKLYGMPLEEVKESLAKIAAELNHPVDANAIAGSEMPTAQRTKTLYEECRERGDLSYFWQFHSAFLTETVYAVAQNPELFFSKISEEVWQSFVTAVQDKNKTMRELAKYDEEMAAILQIHDQNRVFSSDEEMVKAYASIESAKQFFSANKDKYLSKRNALLQ